MVAGQSQNILALSLLLGLALVTNLAAAPVILFRRTRYIVTMLHDMLFAVSA